MPAFVKQRLHVLMNTDRVHKNERSARNREIGAITARRFAFAVVQIQQPFPPHNLEICAQLRVDLLEDPGDPFFQIAHLLEWA